MSVFWGKGSSAGFDRRIGKGVGGYKNIVSSDQHLGNDRGGTKEDLPLTDTLFFFMERFRDRESCYIQWCIN